ncbi:spore coat protein CotJB [Heyndrickxia ginsengihumi]|uniref:CotJB protein n=1 Tax=Heyndrickxia ginsengihumi TaxID=363870 RepID=A0A0A6VE09_9BACI|nr:spore coat protein CotJB [Heyndrickxia ginsengihumi]KHD85796.1 cotJB protein [Heyndrickxia ginsengihumi]MBE6183459.1 spore coat protein CotJB [Bacillus sp. (in: firmicutes)]MCM3022898.1 spore coat protein CotJB [Heyndrickxia ginsengihumi]NEY20674.1 spore coat protein CotJB [Heyndrickxia ginsengihumi]
MKELPPEYYQLLEELQALDFVIVELNLYLDTHPDDQNAIEQYNATVKSRKKVKREFEKHFGPLTSFGYSYSPYPFQWKESPWPWEV